MKKKPPSHLALPKLKQKNLARHQPAELQSPVQALTFGEKASKQWKKSRVTRSSRNILKIYSFELSSNRKVWTFLCASNTLLFEQMVMAMKRMEVRNCFFKMLTGDRISTEERSVNAGKGDDPLVNDPVLTSQSSGETTSKWRRARWTSCVFST